LNFIIGDTGFFFVIGLAAIAILSLVLRRRKSTGTERQQYRWLLLGASLFVLISAAGQVLPEDSMFEVLWLVGGSAIPICICVAVVRYRLFEIDRVISRTVGYVLVVGVLGLVFLGAVTLLTWVSPAESQLAVAGSTLVVAALFNPLRKRLQGWVDRRFNRSKYDAERVMEHFAGSLQDRVDEDELVRGWVGVVSATMEPAAASVWVRGRS
jgi:drug/metabolite transporter (DMT)-like permease